MTRKRRKKSNSRLIIGLCLLLLIVGLYAEIEWRLFSRLMGTPMGMWWIPGLEGAKCKIDGITFPSAVWTGWAGTDVYHSVTEGTGYQMMDVHYLLQHEKVYWERADYFTSNIWWDWWNDLGSRDRLRLCIETEGMIQLDHLNKHGDPLGWVGGDRATVIDAMQFQPNDYRDLTITEDGGETRYSLEKLTVLLVPATIHISISLPPGESPSRHASGWSEGTWEAVEVWFELDFTSWWDVSEPYADDDYLPEWDAEYWRLNPASPYAYNKQVGWDGVNNPDGPRGKGGFPLCGWIQGYLENIGPDWDDEEWVKLFTGSGARDYLLENQGPNELNALTKTSPSLQGRYLGLYSNPEDPFEQTSQLTTYNAIESTARHYPWASAVVPAYFSITVDTLGTWANDLSGIGVGPWDIYYPAVNIELRTIWAVYGHFTYLWTVETARANEYPGWETRKYEQVHVPGPFDWLWDLLSNPVFLIFLFLVIIVIIIVLLAVFAPGMLALGSAIGKRGAHKIYREDYSAWDATKLKPPW